MTVNVYLTKLDMTKIKKKSSFSMSILNNQKSLSFQKVYDLK